MLLKQIYQPVTQAVTKIVTESSAIACVIDEVVDDIEHEDQESQKSKQGIRIQHGPESIENDQMLLLISSTKNSYKDQETNSISHLNSTCCRSDRSDPHKSSC